MVKREYQELEDDDDSSPLMIKAESDSDTISSAKITPKKKPKSTKTGEDKSQKSSAKSRWSTAEDEILITMMEKIIKDNIWTMVKADGRLVSRTSYGVSYHALMLLRQGTGKGPE